MKCVCELGAYKASVYLNQRDMIVHTAPETRSILPASTLDPSSKCFHNFSDASRGQCDCCPSAVVKGFLSYF